MRLFTYSQFSPIHQQDKPSDSTRGIPGQSGGLLFKENSPAKECPPGLNLFDVFTEARRGFLPGVWQPVLRLIQVL
jgi:hypothetical protein